jgi:hypothetical protein
MMISRSDESEVQLLEPDPPGEEDKDPFDCTLSLSLPAPREKIFESLAEEEEEGNIADSSSGENSSESSARESSSKRSGDEFMDTALSRDTGGG